MNLEINKNVGFLLREDWRLSYILNLFTIYKQKDLAFITL
jgi:hypothetical protein